MKIKALEEEQPQPVAIGGTQYTEGQRAEVPDPTPVEMPLGYHHPESLESMIARLVRYESQQAPMQGQETFEESDDFEVEGEDDLQSPYEMKPMQEEYPRGPIKAERSEAPGKSQEKQEVKPPPKAPKKVAVKVEKEPEGENESE